MTWRLEAIGIYSFNAGELREIKFPTSQDFHFISGRMQRGKSALQDIAHYCLMKGKSTIPPGAITDKVDAVGIVLHAPDRRMAIVRPLPEATHLPVTKVWIEVGAAAQLPPLMPTNFPLTEEMALAEISAFTGISGELLKNYEGKNLPGRNISVKHALPYCFQPQEVIANPRSLLPDLEYYYKAQDILTAAEYFFGVLGPEGVAMNAQLSATELELRAAQRRIQDWNAVGVKDQTAALELLAQAQELGLVAKGEPPKNSFDLAAALGSASTDNLQNTTDQHGRLEELAVMLRKIRSDLSQTTEQIGRLSAYDADVALFLEGRQEKEGNLSFSDIVPVHVHESGKCPVCGSKTKDHDVAANQVKAALATLQVEFQLPETARRRYVNERRLLDQRLATLRGQETQALAAQREVQRNLGVTKELENRRAEMMWRIKFYLDNLHLAEKDPRRDVKALEAAVYRLRRKLAEARAMKPTYEAEIAEHINEVAKRLGAEFTEGCHFDIETLELTVKHRGVLQPLHKIGSGANQVIYHVGTILALHRHFRKHQLPVPNLIMLDQPSQAWFPTSREMETMDKPPSSPDANDLSAVSNLYRLLVEEAKKSGIQIVVVDHARPDDPAVQAGLIEEWRSDRRDQKSPDRLVPDGWPARPATTAA